MTNNSGCCYSL